MGTLYVCLTMLLMGYCENTSDFTPAQDTAFVNELFGSPDLDGNGVVTICDFVLFAEQWLRTDCVWPQWCQGADLNRDGAVGLPDFSILADSWLKSANEPDMIWVTISNSGFSGRMSRYETTNAQYALYLNAALASNDIRVEGSHVEGNRGPYENQNYYRLDGPGSPGFGATNGGASRIKYSDGQFTVDSGFENHPVTYVSWYGAMVFANYYGWRLPTEQEWQAVAGYTDERTYATGDALYDSDRFLANYNANGSEDISPKELPNHPWAEHGTSEVGYFGTFGYGLADMSGNVWEWTSSGLGAGRVTRGGGWNYAPVHCRVSYRTGYMPADMDSRLGFRVCH